MSAKRQNTPSASTEKNLTGPMLQEQLRQVGIEAQQVTQRRDSGHYVAEFYYPKMQTPVPPSNLWARMLEERLGNIIILDNHDTVAEWRVGKPVIWASVTFALKPAG